MSLHWLSFADPDIPDEGGFLGVAIVEGDDFLDAVITAHAAGCNPGGEVVGMELSCEARQPPEEFCNRLLSREQVAELEAVMARVN